MMTEEYKSAVKRIRAVNSVDAAIKLEKSIGRVYNAGFFTEKELGRLDLMLLDRRIQLEEHLEGP